MDVAFAAPAGGEVVFEVGICRENGLRAQGRASEVGVQDDAGGVDDAAQRGFGQCPQRAFDARFDRRRGEHRGGAGADFAPRLVEHAADFRDYHVVRDPGRVDTLGDLVDGGQLAQFLVIAQCLMVQRGRGSCPEGATNKVH